MELVIFINESRLMLTMILVFDLSGVFFNNGLKVAIKKISDGLSLSPETVEFVLNGSFAEKYRTGLVESEYFWKNAKSYLKVDDIGKIRQIFFESYYPHEESVKLLKSLREKGVKTAFLSNSPKDRTEFLDKRYRFISMFDFGLFSFEAHTWKPDNNIYVEFLERFKLNPQDIVYIDDEMKNLVPAETLGMKTVLFQDISQFKRKLKEIGITP